MRARQPLNDLELPCSAMARHLYPVMYSRIISEDEPAAKEQKISPEMQDVARALFFKENKVGYA